MEILFLDSWIRSQDHLNKNQDAQDLLAVIAGVLQDGTISSSDLYAVKERIMQAVPRFQKGSQSTEDSIHSLHGPLLGIISDGEITDEELSSLDTWLGRNEYLAHEWPACVLIDRVNEIKEAKQKWPLWVLIGRVNGIKKSKQNLLESLKQITGSRFDETGDAEGSVAEVFSTDCSEFSHQGTRTCFTGKFLLGTRTDCEAKAKAKGAIISKSISSKLDALIIGTIASRDWRFQRHGKKIEKALKFNQAGHQILILSEEDWMKFL